MHRLVRPRPPCPSVLSLLSLLSLSACGPLASLRGGLADSPHEAYARALAEAGLADAALAADWQRAAERALHEPADVTLPFQEVSYADPTAPDAVGYAFALRRGERLRVAVAPPPAADSADATRLFVDLFRLPDDSTGAPAHAANADGASADTLAFTYDVPRDGRYVLRLQPELLRGGRFRVRVATGPSLGFPVAGHDAGDVRSGWGDPRDGGARRHEGIDVFAPRGTPAMAAADGVVARVGEGGLGGKVVWLQARGLGLYYAHLDTQLVAAGTPVRAGDTLGLVGNTGNARGTPPHLHFGVYARNLGGVLGGSGAVDPLPFVAESQADFPAVVANEERLGRRVRLAQGGAPLRAGPEPDARVVRTLERDEPALAVGASRRALRVVLADGSAGYVAADAVEEAERPLRSLRLDQGRAVRARPSASAPDTDSLAAGSTLSVLGRADGFLLVRSTRGREGWIAEP